MEEKEVKKITVEDAGIDKEIVEELSKENVLHIFGDEKQMHRAELNFYCELLAEVRHLQQSVENFINILSICSNKQITEFFSGVRENMDKEIKRQNVQKIIKKSHKKKQNAKKNVK